MEVLIYPTVFLERQSISRTAGRARRDTIFHKQTQTHGMTACLSIVTIALDSAMALDSWTTCQTQVNERRLPMQRRRHLLQRTQVPA